MVLVWLAAPVLIAAGFAGVWAVLRGPIAIRASAVAALAVACSYQWWARAPAMPPMSDPRIERAQNAAMGWLRERARGSRIHIWESPDRHWAADHITVPFGLEAITSYTPSEHRDYLPSDFDPPEHRTFIGESYASPARHWGLLNVRYVLSMTPRSEPGFRLATTVETCPVEVCQPAKSAGPFIYENEQWRPRGWLVGRVIGILGSPEAAFTAALGVMRRPDFDPARVAVLQLNPTDGIPPVDALFSVGTPVAAAFPLERTSAADRITRLLSTAPPASQAAGFIRLNSNRLEFHAPADGWLVASEKAALYPGWTASISAVPAPIFRANGVLAAFRVKAGNVVRLEDRPPHMHAGLVIFAVMVVAITVRVVVERTPS